MPGPSSYCEKVGQKERQGAIDGLVVAVWHQSEQKIYHHHVLGLPGGQRTTLRPPNVFSVMFQVLLVQQITPLLVPKGECL